MKILISTILFITSLAIVYSPASLSEDNKLDNAQMSAINETKVNLNDANYEQLLSLKGIGKKKAQAILTYRQEVGQFLEIEELLLVSGIGKKVIVENENRLVL